MTPLDLYTRDLRRCRFLTRAEESELAARAKQGDLAARNALVESLLPYVVRRAVIFAKKHHWRPAEDLAQDGALGLMRAVELFDPSKGRLSTFATWWLYREMKRAADEDGVIHVPHSAHRADRTEAMACAKAARRFEPLEDLPFERDTDEPANDDELAKLRQRMKRLSPRERDCLLRRMNGELLKTIAADHGICKERVRQIVARALGKMKHWYRREFG